MTTYRGLNLFDSGPSRVLAGPTAEEVRVSRFPGLTGEHHLLMGRPGREIVQDGTLTASSASQLLSRWTAVSDQVGQRGELVDGLSWRYADCVLTRCELVGARRVDASGRHCADYRLTYRQPVDDVT